MFKAKILCVSGNKCCSKKAIKKFNDLALAKKQMDCPVNMEGLLKDGVVDTAKHSLPSEVIYYSVIFRRFCKTHVLKDCAYDDKEVFLP